MVRRHSRARSLVALTVAALLVLLGALQRPLRLYRIRPEPAE